MSPYLRMFQSKIKKPTIWLIGTMAAIVIAVYNMPKISDTIFMWIFYPHLSVTLIKDSLTQEKHPREYFPPLYPGIEWQQVKNDNMSFVSQISKGKVLTRGYRFESNSFQNYPEDLIDYYKEELKMRGWIEIRNYESQTTSRYAYSKLTNFTYVKAYIAGIQTDGIEHHFEFGVTYPGWSKYSGYYKVYVEYSDPDIQR